MAVLQEEGVIIQHWPQYVEVGHERAGELLEWDVRNGLAFFWRRYGVEQGLRLVYSVEPDGRGYPKISN